MAYNLVHDPSSGISFQSGGSAFGDTTYTKVFVGGLAWETQNESLRQYFEQFGETVEAVVITDKNTGRSKGYGFVTFGDPEAARRACADPYPIIDGRRANCNLASLGRPQTILIYGGLSPTSPYAVHVPANFRAYFGSFGYQQPFSCNYKQAYVGPTFGYASFRNAYNSSQGIYNPHFVQQSIPTCGLPGMINTTIYPYEVLAYAMPVPVLQFGLPGTKEITDTSAQASSYPTAVPAQTPFILPATF